MDEKFLLSPTFYLACIGAGAWIPQGIRLYQEYLAKPQLTLRAKKITVGHCLYGPTIKINTALLSEKNPTTIVNVKAIVKHENKQESIFEWSTISNGVEDSTTHSLGGVTVKRSSSEALMLHLPLNFTQVQSLEFLGEDILKKSEETIQPFFDKFARAQRNNSKFIEDFDINIKNMPEWSNLEDLVSDMFIWNVGKYELDLHITALGRKIKYSPLKYTFEITKSNEEDLKTNNMVSLDTVKENLKLTLNPSYLGQYKNFYWSTLALKED
ncbi:hypothetical protein [Desulfovibrio gilichinskyi]|uniref:Uncharacterized protein n=1 Tax=Desulfovibrio gilichinskyi TaxID=1519643 RepID=A0A1X7F1Z7_9BACT|nr:hypothetical protein [Desulfovibrio gilichinskyi]SMF44442.1 hypothetical protein SAMN06295933_3599 [Desulfovibrio gilichinskyi]